MTKQAKWAKRKIEADFNRGYRDAYLGNPATERSPHYIAGHEEYRRNPTVKREFA